MIDTASRYGNEEGVGKAIRESGIPREEIFVTTKLWNTDQGYQNTLKAIDDSLARLQLEYVDLYLVHWPTAGLTNEPTINKREETWRAMEEIYKSDKAKAIGVSNYTITHLEEMKNYMTIPPAVNQVEFHPFLYEKELLEYCHGHNIAVEAHSPFANNKCNDNEVVKNIAVKYNKSPYQVFVRWSLQHGAIPLPKTTDPERMKENINVFNFELSSEDMETLNALSIGLHVRVDPNNFK